jgi:ABC-type glutathione transport system ATPase component
MTETGRTERDSVTERRAEAAQTQTDPAEPLISARDLTRTFRRARTSLLRPGAEVHALRGIDLDVAEGERFGVVGESGSGKSTLVRLLAGLDRPTAGSVRVDGREIGHLPERKLKFLRRQVQIVFQDPMSSLDPRMRVRDIIAEPLVALGLPGGEERVVELLDAVGLPASSARRFPHQFSGGQRQRIAIARALSPMPRVVIADEPVSALDVSIRAQILNLLADLVETYKLTLVFVSHDLAVVRHTCDRVAVLNAGEIVETGPVESVWSAPQHPYTSRLLAAVPTLAAILGDRAEGPAGTGAGGSGTDGDGTEATDDR